MPFKGLLLLQLMLLGEEVSLSCFIGLKLGGLCRPLLLLLVLMRCPGNGLLSRLRGPME